MRGSGRRSIWLVRHASRLDFAHPAWSDSAPRPFDPPLSALGHAQAERVAARLAREPIRYLFSSPFLRCLETAAPIARRTGTPIAIEPALSEWLNPEWFPAAPEVLPPEAAGERFAEVDRTYVPAGVACYPESAEQARARAARAARLLAARFPGDLVLVCHGASLQGAAAGLLDRLSEGAALYPDFPFAGVLRLGSRPGGFAIAEVVRPETLPEARGP